MEKKYIQIFGFCKNEGKIHKMVAILHTIAANLYTKVCVSQLLSLLTLSFSSSILQFSWIDFDTCGHG